MASYGEVEVDQFCDTYDDVSSESNLGSEAEGCLSSGLDNSALGYELWTKEPDSVNERRGKFLEWMGLGSDWPRNDVGEEEDSSHEDKENVTVENLDSEPEYSSSSSVQSSRSYESIIENYASAENLDSGTEFVEDKLADHGNPTEFPEWGSDKMISLNKFQKILGSSELIQKLFRKDCKGLEMVNPETKMKSNWLQRFGGMTNIAERAKGFLRKPIDISSETGSSTEGVRVHVSRKHSKELSLLSTGQEFPAHEGSILTLKFSPDGRYLASAGEDGVVRVWNVVEDDSANKFYAQDIDASCLYLSPNKISKLAPSLAKNKISHTESLKKSCDSDCVILPPKSFHLAEKPLHEFHGHNGEVLALSWSKNGHLLSSSVDKTARLWRVEHDQCLGVYPHNNYVTCVEFNPVDDKHFISGSLDGKLRIWEVQGGRVIDWTDTKEIVTAVCYCPNGKGGVVGFIDGTCRFYDVIDNCLEMGAQVRLRGKRKLPGKRITGFQYCPSDSSKVMVTSADSQVQVLRGTNVICKFKGDRNSGSQAPASFTSDGEHVILATKDSNIRIWNYNNSMDLHKAAQPKKVRSCESFWSRNASIAIPWCGLKNKLLGSLSRRSNLGGNSRNHFDEKLIQKLERSFAGIFMDNPMHRGTATWPEETLLLPKSNNPGAAANKKPSSVPAKSEFKFLKNAWQSAFSSPPHLWGLVVVTAGWDGCIRTFLNYGLPIRF